MTPRPLVGVLALQGDVPEHTLAVRDSGADAITVRRQGELNSVDGLIIPGGESTTLWKLATAFDLFDPIAARIKDGMPAFGSCAGMIMLADRLADGVEGQRTFGGIDMTVRRNAFGRQVDSFESELTFEGEQVHAVFIRAPAVEEVGDAVTVLAKTVPAEDDHTGRIVAVRQGTLLATAFHPELTPDRRIHKLFVDIVRGNR
ncbi:MAG TPA: pyridoxal 5'-phosphate synthase glutaminase subunit PdxT [Streptosporangiaceae bacterium]|jgi:5'-phosphate synthase pdxT subunit